MQRLLGATRTIDTHLVRLQRGICVAKSLALALQQRGEHSAVLDASNLAALLAVCSMMEMYIVN